MHTELGNWRRAWPRAWRRVGETEVEKSCARIDLKINDLKRLVHVSHITSLQCGVESAESGLWVVKYKVWSVECKVRSIKCGVWSVK